MEPQFPQEDSNKFNLSFRAILILFLIFLLGGLSFLAPSYLLKNQSQSVSLVKDETKEWKTYRNEEYGFEFKYPKEWSPQTYNNQESKIIVSVNYKTSGNKDVFFTINYFGPGSGTQTIEKWKSSHTNSGIYFREPVLSGEKVLESYESECIAEDGQCTNSIVVGFNSNTLFKENIDISLYIDDDTEINNSEIYDKYKNEVEVIENILSTFKFVATSTSSDISTWKTYRNEEYGFEFKYPIGWTYKIIGNSIYFKAENYDPPSDYPPVLNVGFHKSFIDFKTKYFVEENSLEAFKKSNDIYGEPTKKAFNNILWICSIGDGPGDIESCSAESKNSLVF